MKWWFRLKFRLSGMRKLKDLGLEAERIALTMHEDTPGAEHYVLASLGMPDNSSRQAFRNIQADPDAFYAAIGEQYRLALLDAGISMPTITIDSHQATDERKAKLAFNAKADVNALYKNMYKICESAPEKPLLGAQVIAAATQLERGVVPRAFDAMGVNRSKLRESALHLISEWGS